MATSSAGRWACWRRRNSRTGAPLGSGGSARCWTGERGQRCWSKFLITIWKLLNKLSCNMRFTGPCVQKQRPTVSRLLILSRHREEKFRAENRFLDSPKCPWEAALYHQSRVVSGVSSIPLNRNIRRFGFAPCFNVGGGGPSHARKQLWTSSLVSDDDLPYKLQFRWFLLEFNNYQTLREHEHLSVIQCHRLALITQPSSLKQAWYFEKGFLLLAWTQVLAARKVFHKGGNKGLEMLLDLATRRWLSNWSSAAT